MKSTLLTGLFVFVLGLLLAGPVTFAQGVGSSGDIRGTLTDPAGGVIPRATIIAEDAEKGIRRTSVTDENGEYEFSGLPPATYRLTARISGFQTEILRDAVVSVGQTVILDFRMKISAGTEVVEVNTEAPVVETEMSHQADTINEQYIRELPINRRDYLTYTLLVPGVSDSTRMASDVDFRVKQTPQSGLSFYGSNGRGNSVTVDGGEANGDTGGVRPTLSQDAVQEFQINRSNYSADLGGGSGASINIVSKSGTNRVHGSLYGFFRNDVFDAADPFAFSQALQPGQTFNPAAADTQGKNVKNSLSRQQYGGTLGFPIKKDKTFLFVAFEGLRQDAQTAVPLLTDTGIFRPTSRQQAFLTTLAALPGNPTVPCLSASAAAQAGVAANQTAAACAATLKNALTVAPGTGLGQLTARSAYLVSQFESNGGLFPFNTREYQGSGRFDHQFSDRNQVFVRYGYTHDLEENPDLQSLTGFSRGSSIHTYDNTLLGAWFHQFSPNTSNEARVQWNYNSFNVIPNVLGQAGLDIPGFANLGNQIFIPSISILRRYEFADNFAMIRGRHTMKMGGYGLIRGNHTESHTFFPGRFVFGSLGAGAAPTGSGLLSPCLIAPASGTNACGLSSGVGLTSLQAVSAVGAPQFYQQGFDNPTTNYARPFGAAYWQDSWALRSNFSLNFGVRYELDVQYGNLNTDKDNFAPRVSFSWDPFKDHKTVVRGGFGMFYGTIDRQITDVVNYLGIVNGFRQIAQVFVPINTPITSSTSIFTTLFNATPNGGKIAPCTLAPGQVACITAADIQKFPDPSTAFPTPGVLCLACLKNIAITHTGPNPFFTVLFNGAPDYQNPYSEQGEFGIEREIAGGLSVSASYIYVHTLKIPVAIDTNLLPAPLAAPRLDDGTTSKVLIRQWLITGPAAAAACPGGAVNIFTGAATCFKNFGLLQTNQYSSAGSSLYQGAILEIKKRFSNHYALIGNYTYSKALDTTTDFNSDFAPNDQTCLSCERGLSSFDQRHKVVVAGVFGSPWKGRVLSGFELSPIVRYNSSHPFELLAGTNVNQDRHSTTDRPPGVGRNTGIGPNFVDFDMRLSWRYKMREKADLQFIAEGFNILNRTNFGSVNNVVGVIAPPAQPLQGDRTLSPSQPLGFTSALPKRQLQFGVRLSF